MGETTGFGRHLRDKIDTYHNRNSLESMKVTLRMGDTESELTISNNQVRLSVQGLGQQSIHKSSIIQFVLATIYARIYVAQKWWE